MIPAPLRLASVGTGSSTELSSRLRVHVCSQSCIFQASLNSTQLQIVLFISAYVKASSGKPRTLPGAAQVRSALVAFRRSSLGWMQTLQCWVWEKLLPLLLIQRLWILVETFHLPVYTVLSHRHSLQETMPLEAPFSSVLWSCCLKGRTDRNIWLGLFYIKCRKGLLSPGEHGCRGTAGSVQWNIGSEIVAPVPETYPGSSGAWSRLLRCCHAINTW